MPLLATTMLVRHDSYLRAGLKGGVEVTTYQDTAFESSFERRLRTKCSQELRVRSLSTSSSGESASGSTPPVWDSRV